MTQQSHYWAYTLRKPKFKKHVHANVHGSIVYNRQDMAKYSSTNEWIKKKWYIFTRNITHP